MALEVQTFRPFTIRVWVRGTLRTFAALLDKSSGDLPRGSMLGNLATNADLPGLPRYELRAGGVFVFEAYVEESLTAEVAYEQLIAELKLLGFESVS